MTKKQVDDKVKDYLDRAKKLVELMNIKSIGGEATIDLVAYRIEIAKMIQREKK